MSITLTPLVFPQLLALRLTGAFFSLDVIILRAKTVLQESVFTDAIFPVYTSMH
jgi:hypothetical protein